MQRYQTEDEHRKAMRAKINKTIKRGRRRKRIIRRLKKAVPGICIGVFIAGMGAWCIAAPLPDPDDYEPYRFQAENGQWYTQEEYEQMSRERDAYHQREREEAEKEAQMIRDYQEQYQNRSVEAGVYVSNGKKMYGRELSSGWSNIRCSWGKSVEMFVCLGGNYCIHTDVR